MAVWSLYLTLAYVVMGVTSFGPGPGCPTYGQLAQMHLTPATKALSPALLVLNESVLPSQVKSARKSVLALRNLFDIFSPIFPNATGECNSSSAVSVATHKTTDGDMWIPIRESLHSGYVLIGDYQDLDHSGVNYTTSDLLKRLQPVLEWYADWKLFNFVCQYEEFIFLTPEIPQQNGFSHDKQSQFFWGGFDLPLPVTTPGVSGLAGVRELVHAQLKGISNRSDYVLDVKDILDPASHAQFHDFRKAMRAVVDTAAEFSGDTVPLFDPTNPNVTSGLALLDSLYDQYGDLNDEWNAYTYYLDHGDKKQAAKESTELSQQWDWLKGNQTKDDVHGAMKGLEAGFSTAC